MSEFTKSSGLRQEDNKFVCSNCNNPFEGNYCPNCGQKASTGRITFKETFSNFLSSTFALEAKLPQTIALMVLNPGKLFMEFIGGKRNSYYKPISFFVLSTVVYIILRELLGFDPLEGELEQLNQQDLPRYIELIMEAARFMVDNINNIMFLLAFSIAIVLKLFFLQKIQSCRIHLNSFLHLWDICNNRDIADVCFCPLSY